LTLRDYFVSAFSCIISLTAPLAVISFWRIRMNYERSFRFVTEDEQWLSKVIIGGLLYWVSGFIIPLLPLLGYLIELLQNVMRSNPNPLPTWDNFDVKFKKGLNAFVIGLVYFAPLLLVACCFILGAVGLGAASGNGRSANDTASSLVFMLTLCFMCFTFLYVIVASVFTSAATIFYAANEQLSDAFKFGDVLTFIRNNASQLIPAILVAFVANIVGALLGAIACGVGSLITVPFAMMVQYHLLGQVYQASLGAASSSAMAPPNSSM
jgi:hypothetical protein